MKILNLYAGIGGNRKLWGDNHDFTAVELDVATAEVYKDLFPDDRVVVADAHEYLLKNYKEFDFIWSSPPCPSHSRARFGFGVCGHGYDYIYPDMAMYQEIILLRHAYGSIGNWCVENVIPYYEYLLEPSTKLGRHAYWSNFFIQPKVFSKNGMIAGNTKPPGKLANYRITGEKDFFKKMTGFNLDGYSGFDKRKALRNCVEPEAGLHILNCAIDSNYSTEQSDLFESLDC